MPTYSQRVPVAARARIRRWRRGCLVNEVQDRTKAPHRDGRACCDDSNGSPRSPRPRSPSARQLRSDSTRARAASESCAQTRARLRTCQIASRRLSPKHSNAPASASACSAFLLSLGLAERRSRGSAEAAASPRPDRARVLRAPARLAAPSVPVTTTLRVVRRLSPRHAVYWESGAVPAALVDVHREHHHAVPLGVLDQGRRRCRSPSAARSGSRRRTPRGDGSRSQAVT